MILNIKSLHKIMRMELSIIYLIILKIDKLNIIEIGFDYYQNNSLGILKKCNKALFVDGDSKKAIILRNVLKLFYPKTKITVQNTLVDIDNINLIKEQNFTNQEEIDFLSIDVDGIDYYLFKEINFKPKLICIEYNFWFGKDLSCAEPYEKKLYIRFIIRLCWGFA